MEISLRKMYSEISMSPMVRGIYVTSLNQKVVSQNGSRVAITFFNYGLSDIWLLPDISNVGFYGFNLPPFGGVLHFSVARDFLLPTSQWYASSSSGNPELAYIAQYSSPSQEKAGEENG